MAAKIKPKSKKRSSLFNLLSVFIFNGGVNDVQRNRNDQAEKAKKNCSKMEYAKKQMAHNCSPLWWFKWLI